MYEEKDFLQLAGLQHFSFCRRQWALIYIEMQWQENLRTTEGHLLHQKAHDPYFTEKRQDLLISRELPVFSRMLGVSGQCDVVEFHASSEGVSIFGRDGKWLPVPVEYKRGTSKEIDADRLQLCCQAMCLEEMLVCPPIESAYLYYGQTRKREEVRLDCQLRSQVRQMLGEMHRLYEKQHTPKVRMTKSCNACSLKEICLPKLMGHHLSAGKYLKERLEEME